MSKYRLTMPKSDWSGSSWSGPTSADILAASGRAQIVVHFYSIDKGRRRELLVNIGEAFRGIEHNSVTFKGRTYDGRFTISGTLASESRGIPTVRLAFEPVLTVVRRAS